jgi:hypothetical protein
MRMDTVFLRVYRSLEAETLLRIRLSAREFAR